ncbi:hypothetical protein Z043_106163 [Scleropages formosus]|uniref:G-protein coupled receptors family 1 profile domain-containing protein n=1 Tax=Scleropages formosus TaxID=113540 RepID=A0A0P7VM51_SCLFO|nr:hypothetical protein Z043_106163 [Scleropages formosus]
MDGSMDGFVPQVCVPVLDTLIMVTGLVGHSLVIIILAGRWRRGRQLPHGTDSLLLGLSATDLLLLSCLPFHTTAIALGQWPFGSFLCKTVSFLGVACSSASVFTLVALAVSRYVIVVHPTLAYRSRMQRSFHVAPVALWVPALALAAPQFAFRTVSSSTQLACFAFLSDLSQLMYSTALFLITFAIPLIIIAAMYAKIYCFLRDTRQGCRTSHLLRYQSQVTHTSVLLVLVFMACWLPSYILMFLLVGKTVSNAPGYRAFGIFVRLLASSASVANPILYVFNSTKFRKDLLQVGRESYGAFRKCCRRHPRGGNAVQPFHPMVLGPPLHQ